ncbi:MAG: universal stress protein [Pyrinomonadaceae bacterium]
MKIIIATDGSTFSEAAIKECCEIIIDPGRAEIKIVSAYQAVIPFNVHSPGVAYSTAFDEVMKKQAEQAVFDGEQMVRTAFPDSGIKINGEVLVGAVDNQIVEAAESWDADLIVVGSHGRGFWGRVMLGSISDSLVHHAPCSVLVVRKRKENEERVKS